MEFKKSKYYNKEFLGNFLYLNIFNSNKILTVQEYFGINDVEKEYSVKDKESDYKLKIYSNYYELDCQKCKNFLFLVFDKPVNIIGKFCTDIIAPEIFIKSSTNISMYQCISNKVTIDNKLSKYYRIGYSKIKNVYFYNSKVRFWDAEIENFFIFDENLCFEDSSYLLKHYKIKCFGRCKSLNDKISNDKDFKERIIHVE